MQPPPHSLLEHMANLKTIQSIVLKGKSPYDGHYSVFTDALANPSLCHLELNCENNCLLVSALMEGLECMKGSKSLQLGSMTILPEELYDYMTTAIANVDCTRLYFILKDITVRYYSYDEKLFQELKNKNQTLEVWLEGDTETIYKPLRDMLKKFEALPDEEPVVDLTMEVEEDEEE